MFRTLFPTTKWSLELNAVITKIVFAWMVGPMEVQMTTDNDLGEEMLSKVHIKKCRWCVSGTLLFFLLFLLFLLFLFFFFFLFPFSFSF